MRCEVFATVSRSFENKQNKVESIFYFSFQTSLLVAHMLQLLLKYSFFQGGENNPCLMFAFPPKNESRKTNSQAARRSPSKLAIGAQEADAANERLDSELFNASIKKNNPTFPLILKDEQQHYLLH